MKIYLSGSMSTGNNWQDLVKQWCNHPEFEFIDPRNHGLTEPKEYTKWDLERVFESNIIFAYMDKDNPSGYGLTLEVGYAKALHDKIIIMIDELNKPNMAIVRCCADYLCDNLKDGINILNEIYKALSQTIVDLKHKWLEALTHKTLSSLYQKYTWYV